MIEYQHGGDIYSNKVKIDYSANLNPFGLPEGVKHAIIKELDVCSRYPDSQSRELKHALSLHHQILPQQIICGNGAADLIFQIVLARKPKKALLLAPTFGEYEQALKTTDCDIVDCALEESDGFSLDANMLKAHMNSSFDIMFLCNPNNPTGIAVSSVEMEAIVAEAQRLDIFVVVDECFCDFLVDKKSYSVLPLIERYQNLFILKAFTKLYSMAGIRLGYGICSDATVLDSIELVRQPWSVSTLAQVAGVAALRDTAYVEKTLDVIAKERIYMKQKLEDMGFFVYPSHVNYLFFRDMEHRTDRTLYDLCLEQGVLIRSCSNYRGLDSSYYRICVKTRKENEEFLRIVIAVVQQRRVGQ